MSRTADVPSFETDSAAASPGARDPVVRFDSVGLRFGRGAEILSDLNFELEAGSFHFLTGASGAGKTSLLRMIQMTLPPSRGEVTLFGRDTASLGRNERTPLRRRIGMVFHDRRLLEHLDAFDNVALPLRLAGAKPSDYRSDVIELLTWVGLGQRLTANPISMSGGEQQRLAIARAVVTRPDLLIADEPTGDVDHAMALRILRLFLELNRLGATVLIATHDETLVARSGRPVLHIEKGKLSRSSGRFES